MNSIRARGVVLLLALLLLGQSAAQAPLVPEDRLDRRFELAGDTIRFCLGTRNPLTEFDRAIATEIAHSLLLEAEFIEIPPNFPLYEEHDFLEALFILLINDCDAFLGFNLTADGYPDWLTFSRPYASFPFQLAVVEEEYESLADIPRDRPLGAPMLSQVEGMLIGYLQSLPAQERWRRFPYADQELLLERLMDGTLGGAFFWAPELDLLLANNEEAQAQVRTVATAPLPSTSAVVGIALLRDDTFLRSSLDEAIATLIEDGVITELLEEYELTGRAGG